MTARIGQIASQLDPRTWSGKGLPAHSVKHDDDVVIVAMGRTPFCRAKKGELKDTPFDFLCLEMFKGLLAKSQVDPKIIEDVVVGNVRNDSAAYAIRAAALAAGIPHTSPTLVGEYQHLDSISVVITDRGVLVNRFCSSGLMAVRSVANQIQCGEIDCGIAIGVESMSNHSADKHNFSDEVKGANQEADDCRMPMGWTSENVAGDFNISREKMDAFAARSHSRAAAARESGRFDAEIFPITVPTIQDGQKSYKTVSADDGIRVGSTPESLSKIKSAFPQWQPANTTGGNASQLTDGGAGVLMMRRSLAHKLGKKVIAKYIATAVSGLPPRIMGIGPSLAVPKVLELTGITPEQVDLYEINEAFASMAVYCQEKLNIDSDKLNVNGGAIALGHPLGSTGARLVVTALAELERRKQHVAVVSMCIGL